MKRKYFGFMVMFFLLSMFFWAVVAFFSNGLAKPVIYLYPTTNTEISVNVYPLHGISISDPIYKDGWKVISDSDSNILNLDDNKTYPYLFWESNNYSLFFDGLKIPKEGFVISRDNLQTDLSDKLLELGLNKKEVKDFEDFWIPKMLQKNKPYYFKSKDKRLFYSLLRYTFPVNFKIRPNVRTKKNKHERSAR